MLLDDWSARDVALEDFVAELAARRRALPALRDPVLRHDARWYRLDGTPMRDSDWHGAAAVELQLPEFTISVDRAARRVEVRAVPLNR